MILDNDQEKFADVSFDFECLIRYKIKNKFIFLSFRHEVNPFWVR
jgi:hypothetical protein